MRKNPLQRQLEDDRFLRAISYVKAAAQGPKKLTTSELQILNQMLTGEESEAWRLDAVTVKIPGGIVHEFNVISNPINRAREIISEGEMLIGNSQTVEAALHLYIEFVRAHLFKEANRRTGVLALVWVLAGQNVDVDPLKILHLPIGNLRQADDVKNLKSKIQNIVT